MKKYINFYTLIGIVLSAVIMIITWGLSTRVFEYIINNTKTELGGSQAEFIISFGFSHYMIEGFSIMQLILPLFSVWFSFSFKRLIDGYYGFAKPRLLNYKKTIIKDMLIISSTASAALYLGFLLFYLFGLLTHPVVISENFYRSFLNDIFDDGFAWKNPVLYYLIEGLYKYVVFPFFYCLFSCSIKIYYEKDYMSIIIPIGYYVFLSVFAGVVSEPFYGSVIGDVVKALRPSNMLMMGAEAKDVPLLYPLISLLPVMAATIFFLWKGISNEKEHN